MELNELELLTKSVKRQSDVFNACDPNALGGFRRMLTETWLAEIGLLVERLRRDVAQLPGPKPPAVGSQLAWKRYWQVYSALSPISKTVKENEPPDPARTTPALIAVADRLILVITFLSIQILVAIGLLVYTLIVFSSVDLQSALTGEQFESRKLLKSHIERLITIVDTEQQRAVAPAPAAPSPTGVAPGNASPAVLLADDDNVVALRGEIEGVAASLNDMTLAKRDAQTTNSWLQAVLSAIDRDPPDYANARSALAGLSSYLVIDRSQAPGLLKLITLGSLLGMITITIHLNWKWRNRWDTVGYIPWYVTKLIGAPVLSISAIGLMSQFTLTTNLSEAKGFSDLGLAGAQPLLIFSVAILTGLFSNRVFDWLKSMVQDQTPGTGGTAAPPSTDPEAEAEKHQSPQPN